MDEAIIKIGEAVTVRFKHHGFSRGCLYKRMKKIPAKKIATAIKKLFLQINFNLPTDIIQAIKIALKSETNPKAKIILKQILENEKIARNEKIPLCQDTGTAIVFIEIGQNISITDGCLTDAVNKGIRQAYNDGYLRKSIVSDPLKRKNTNDNTPGVIHTEIVPGDKLKITGLAKGGGAENMSALKIFPPLCQIADIKNFIIKTVKDAGANACPPVIVGIGIGGTFDTVGLLAKKSLLRRLNSHNSDEQYKRLEEELLDEINKTNIGPMALGGKTTALAVLIEIAATHITSLPVAVNMQCHSLRRGSIVL